MICILFIKPIVILSLLFNDFILICSIAIFSPTAYTPTPLGAGARNGTGISNRLASNSPAFGQSLRGTRGSHVQHARSPTPMASAQPQHYYRPIQSPLTVGYCGPRPYRAPSFSPVPMHQHMHSGSQPPEYMYSRMTPLQAPSPAFELAPRYEYVAVPLEPSQPGHSYVIYDGDDENTLSTAEIIERQSQDYVDEQLAQFEQNTIAKLQGK